MKKLVAALLVAVSVSGMNVFACGGMTQVDPPCLQVDVGCPDESIESIMDEIEGCLVIC